MFCDQGVTEIHGRTNKSERIKHTVILTEMMTINIAMYLHGARKECMRY